MEELERGWTGRPLRAEVAAEAVGPLELLVRRRMNTKVVTQSKKWISTNDLFPSAALKRIRRHCLA